MAACNRDLKFTYVLPGWEGSAADSKVLRDALVRQDPLVVPKGNYAFLSYFFSFLNYFYALVYKKEN